MGFRKEELAGMSKEERIDYFRKHKSELLLDDLAKANGGTDVVKVENPDSEEYEYKGNLVSSFGYICNGEVWC